KPNHSYSHGNAILPPCVLTHAATRKPMDYVNLNGKTALVLGIANRWSIAYAIAQLLQEHGVRLPITYQNERTWADVLNLTSYSVNFLYLACELTNDAQIDATFSQIKGEL